MKRPMRTTRRGVILLEVVLALSLLAIGAAVVGSSMRRSLQAIDRMRRRHKAAILAESVLAQLSTNAIELADCPPTELGVALGFTEDDDLPPHEQPWSYEIVTEEITDMTGLLSVSVIIRHADSPEAIAGEVTQWMRSPAEVDESGREAAP